MDRVSLYSDITTRIAASTFDPQLADTLLTIGDRFRAAIRASVGDPNFSFEHLDELTPHFLYCYDVAVGAQLPLGFVRLRVDIADAAQPVIRLDEQWFWINEAVLIRPHSAMLGVFMCAFYGPIDHAFAIILHSDGSFSRCVKWPNNKQPETTTCIQRHWSAMYGAFQSISKGSELAALFRLAMELFRKSAMPNALPANDEVSAFPVPQRPLREAIVLYDDAYAFMEHRIALFAKSHAATPRGICIQGPSGTGKSLLTQTFAQLADAEIVTIRARGRQAEKAINDAFGNLIARRTIIHFECAEVTLVSADRDESARESIDALLRHWRKAVDANADVMVIFNVTNIALLDTTVRELIGAETLDLSLPNGEQRRRIVHAEFDKFGMTYIDDVEMAAGLSGRDIASLVATTAANNISGEELAPAFAKAVMEFRSRRSSGVDDASWSSLILPQDLFASVKGIAHRWSNAEALSDVGFSIPRTLLLTGPPGSGKTHIARTLANELGLVFVGVGPGEIFGRYRGHTALNIRALFARAAVNEPTIIFLDDIDAFGRRRGDDASAVEALTQLLHEMDGLVSPKRRVFLLAATNRRDTLDPALLSRFEQELDIPLPDAECRRRLIKNLLVKLPLDFEHEFDHYLAKLVQYSDGKSGRDLRTMLTSIEDSAIERAVVLSSAANARINVFDIEMALRKIS